MESQIAQQKRSHVRIALLLLGMATGTVARLLSARIRAQFVSLRNSVAMLEMQVEESVAHLEQRITVIESRLQEHENRFQEMPSIPEIVAAVEGLLAKSITDFENRLTLQADSVELLRTTVSQTDNLLERVLESLDALGQDAGQGD